MKEQESGYLFESVTEYDIDGPKRFDMKLGAAKRLVITGYEGEKIRILLASDTLSTIQNEFKMKIDDIRKRMDVEVKRGHGVSEEEARKAVSMFVQVPAPYIGKVECAVSAESVEIRSLACESLELDIKVPVVTLEDVTGTVEMNCDLDMEIFCQTLNGEVTVNQVSASSRIHIPNDVPFTAEAKGIRTELSYEADGKMTEDFSVPDAKNRIELNGMKSKLVICKTTMDSQETAAGTIA